MYDPLERGIFIGGALLIAFFVAGFIWTLTSGETSGCPEGQELKIAYYVPTQTGKVTTQTPVFQCRGK